MGLTAGAILVMAVWVCWRGGMGFRDWSPGAGTREVVLTGQGNAFFLHQGTLSSEIDSVSAQGPAREADRA